MSIAFAKMLIFAAPLGCLEETLALCSLMAADAELYLPGAEAAAERQKVGRKTAHAMHVAHAALCMSLNVMNR